jgi:hypothetical protein
VALYLDEDFCYRRGDYGKVLSFNVYKIPTKAQREFLHNYFLESGEIDKADLILKGDIEHTSNFWRY